MKKVELVGAWPFFEGKILSIVNDHTNSTVQYRPATKNHVLNYKDEIKLQTQLYKVWRYERMARTTQD